MLDDRYAVTNEREKSFATFRSGVVVHRQFPKVRRKRKSWY